MSASAPLGYASAIANRRELILATAPRSARMRILGRRPPWKPVKTHRIEIDLRAGTIEIESRDVVHLPTPQTVNPFRPRIARAELPHHCLEIFDAVATAWDVKVGEIQGKSQQRRFVHPRFAAVWLIRTRMQWSLPHIGRTLRCHHTGIMHSLRRAEELYAHDAVWREKYDAASAALERAGEPR